MGIDTRYAFETGIGRVPPHLLNTNSGDLAPPIGSDVEHATALPITLVQSAREFVVATIVGAHAKGPNTGIFFGTLVAVVAGALLRNMVTSRFRVTSIRCTGILIVAGQHHDTWDTGTGNANILHRTGVRVGAG